MLLSTDQSCGKGEVRQRWSHSTAAWVVVGMLLPHVVFHVQFLAFQYRLDNCYVIRLITVEYIPLLKRKMKWYSDLLFLFLPACRMGVFSLKFRMNFCTIQSQHLSVGIRCATISTEKKLLSACNCLVDSNRIVGLYLAFWVTGSECLLSARWWDLGLSERAD